MFYCLEGKLVSVVHLVIVIVHVYFDTYSYICKIMGEIIKGLLN